MMYPYMTLNDDTEITHSEMYPDGKVYIETPDETGGISWCYLLVARLYMGSSWLFRVRDDVF